MFEIIVLISSNISFETRIVPITDCSASILFGNSLKLSNGSFGHRKQQDKVIVEDEPKFLKWVQGSNLNHLTKVTYKPVLKEIKEYVKSSAELPDGLPFIEGKPKFYAKANETV